MKKLILFILCFCMSTAFLMAKDLSGIRIYVNPGHGSFGPNDRPMATIPYPNLSSTGMPDTCGFYETNTNLRKGLYLGKKLEEANAFVMYSHTQAGPWPYEKVDGQYPDYTWDNYKNLPDYTKYNRNLSEICEEVEANNMDWFISIHSNALTEGTSTNYPLILYRGKDDKSIVCSDSKERGQKVWPYVFEAMEAGLDPATNYSANNPNVRGDIDFMGSSSTTTAGGHSYTGYYGVLRHGCPGYLCEGYFHTYQPARHRALNHDYNHQEGLRHYRGVCDWYGADPETIGYVMGTVKDLHEKMNHPLFKYNPKTNDQWVPCNKAVVTLYKAGEKIAEYTVDTCYNGIFYFENLVPGDDYTLDATCEGYKPLFDEYKVPFAVKANETAHPMIFLEAEGYEPPKEIVYDYPDAATKAWAEMPSAFNMQKTKEGGLAEVLAQKTILRTLFRGDSLLYVLAVDAENKSFVYCVNNKTQELTEVSTEGTAGLYYSVGDIALTADGILLGCNYGENQYDASQVGTYDAKERGTLYIYKWEDINAAPTVLFTSQLSGNFYNATVGKRMTYSGTLEEGTLLTAAVNCNPTSKQIRIMGFDIENGTSVAEYRNQDGANISELVYGEDWTLAVSPRAEKTFVFSGSLAAPMEFTFGGDAKAPLIVSKGTEPVVGAGYMKYARHSLMAVPVMNEDKYTGVALYDITGGFDKAELVITNTVIDAATAEHWAAAGAMMKNDNLTLMLALDNNGYVFSSEGLAQGENLHVGAYNLALSTNSDGVTFTYTATADALHTSIVFYQEDKECGRVAVEPAKKGLNNALVTNDQLPEITETPTTWAVELTYSRVTDWQQIFGQTASEMGLRRVFNTIDNSPESDHFQNIYLTDYSSSIRMTNKQGAYVINPDYTRVNTEPYLGGNEVFGCMYRLSIDSEGTVYMPDWSDPNSGVFVADKGDFTSMKQFFKGERDKDGVFTYEGVETGSSSPGVFVYGKGKDTKLIVYNEDKGKSLVTNGICIYDIGQEDGTILHEWDKAPSKVLSIPGQANSEGNVWACEQGIWVSQNRESGNNNYSATSLQFFNWEGERKMCSADDEYNEIIIGSRGSAFAISNDGKTLVLNGDDNNFLVFDLTWNEDTPTLKLRYAYKHGFGGSSSNAFRQLNFDYAGNLIASGDPGLYVFAMPAENNTTLVPAKASLALINHAVSLTGISLTEPTLELREGAEHQLEVEFTPADATNKNITWTSSDEAIATVDEHGMVHALAVGVATVTVTSEDGNLTAVCVVTVIAADTQTDNVSSSKIYCFNGVIYNPEGISLSVYNMSGQLVSTGNGNITLPDAAGVYIVRTATETIKVRR